MPRVFSISAGSNATLLAHSPRIRNAVSIASGVWLGTVSLKMVSSKPVAAIDFGPADTAIEAKRAAILSLAMFLVP